MKYRLLLLLLLLPCFRIQAQIEHPGRPLSERLGMTPPGQAVVLPEVTDPMINRLKASLSPVQKKMLFAFPFDTLIDSGRNGQWDYLPDGSSIWRLTVRSKGAQSINLIFNRFRLPEGAALYLYTPGYELVRGAFTREEQTPSGVLPTVPLPGEQITVELNLPPGGLNAFVEISRISHDFTGVFRAISLKRTPGECNVDINCPAGAEWQTEKKSVVKFIRGGVWLCSGALINNTRHNGRALLLTANHTISSQSHAEQSVFFFRYERAECGNGSGSLQYTMSGSTLLATTSKVDFCLVELNTVPPKEYDPYYAGWDRRIVPFLDSVTCIHHPNGAVKKISKSFHRVFTADFGGGYDTNTHWKISQWDLGTTEPGSSGSPLFNTDHRIVGDLTGGDASCSYNFNDYFQKFSVSWDKYPDSSNQLKYWLDPDLTGVQVLNGYDPYGGGKPVANFLIRPDRIEAGRKVYFTDASTGLPISWTWRFEGGTPESSALQVPGPVKFDLPGTYEVLLKIMNNLGTDSIRQTITVFPAGGYAVSENRVVPGRKITLMDRSRRDPVSVEWRFGGLPERTDRGDEVDLSYPEQGEYPVTQFTDFGEFRDTLIHYSQLLVVSDPIIYKPFTFSNIDEDEHRGYISMNSIGYLPGSNNTGITAYAEAFSNRSDSIFIINGITVSIENRSKWGGNYYLPIVFWNAKKQVIYRDSVLVTDKEPGSRVTKWFRSPVNLDTLLYAGFEVRPWEQGTFVSAMATDRGLHGKSTAYVIKNGQMQPISEVTGLRTSLDLSLETSILKNSFKEEIRMITGYGNGHFEIDLGNLVFRDAEVAVYNARGQEVMASLTGSGNRMSLQILPPVSGVYFARIRIDRLQFAVRFVILNQ